jgi:hypothetical protein
MIIASKAARLPLTAPRWLRRLAELGLYAALVHLTSACGTGDDVGGGGSSGAGESGEGEAVAKSASESDAADGKIDDTVTPPQAYYDALMAKALTKLDQQSFALLDAPHVLWANFDGATVAKGFGDGESFIVCRGTAQIPASGFSPADRDAVIAMVQEFYDKANAKLTVTADKPAAGTSFTTMHVGGSYRDLGCVGGSGVLGIAPFDVGNANDEDVGFAFLPSGISLRTVAETIAHEAGHSYGLDHVQNTSDVMHASSTSNIQGFLVSRVQGSAKTQDGPAVLQAVLGAGVGTPAGPSTPTTPTTPSAPAIPGIPTTPGAGLPAIPGLPNLPIDLANLPGLGQIGGIGQLLPDLLAGAGGAGGAGALDITSLLPDLQALIPLLGSAGAGGVIPGIGTIPGIGNIAGGGTFPGLDQILTIVGVAAQAGGGAGTVPFSPAAAAGILGSLTGGGAGGVPLDLNALIDMAGFGSAGGAVSSLQPLLAGLLGGVAGGALPIPLPLNGTTTPAIAAPSSVPDLSALLGLAGSCTDPASLLQNLAGSAAVVNGNFSGPTQDALLSLLTVAYGQSYAGMTGLVP